QLRACALDVAEGAVWLEQVKLKTRGVEATWSSEREDALGQLMRALDALPREPGALLELQGAFSELKRKLPREASEGEDGLRLEDAEFYAALLPEVRELLLS